MILKPIFGVSQQATAFDDGDGHAAQRLETVVRTVTQGCHATFQHRTPEALVACLNTFDPEIRGFAYEGAGTGLAALDCVLPRKNRTKTFLDGPGSPYIYAVHIGAGLALARLRRHPERFLPRLDPVIGWMAVDGYGFHEGFFARRRFVTQQVVPTQLSIYGRHAFDQGLGRAIWFLSGGVIARVIATIAAFQTSRQADLWSGVGLACGYTGGVERAAIEVLQLAAGEHRIPLAVGAAIAADARYRAGSPAPYAKLSCAVLCGLSIEQASHMVELALQDLPLTDAEPAYAIWRRRIAALVEEPLMHLPSTVYAVAKAQQLTAYSANPSS
jgi:hypothetical protein